MKKKLLLFISKYNHSRNIPVASTLAWLSHSKNYLFDNYYDSYHQGEHFPGGDSRNLEEGKLTGGTVSGDRHFEEFYFMLHNFDVEFVSQGESIFISCLKNLNIPILVLSSRLDVLYNKIFEFFNVPLPSNIVIIGSKFGKHLSGLESFMFPEIYYRKALGIPDSISEEELANLCDERSKIFCLYTEKDLSSRLRKSGHDVEVIDELTKDDNYLSITERLANRWQENAKGWIIGDPMLVTHWLPKACEENLVAVFSIPLEDIITQLGDLLSARGNVIYGRPYSDKDFFTLSRLNQCFQVIDPCRPPFQSAKHVNYRWHAEQTKEGFYELEYSDEELKQFAQEKRVLISLMFWSGMIREIANFYNLMDLFAMTKLRCGLVLTAQSFEYMMHSPLELLVVPIHQGGVYPNVEPLLGSCGVGVGIESYFTSDKLQENLEDALFRIKQIIRAENFRPCGWWTTMDADLERLSWWKRPKFIRLLRYSPYFQIRFNKNSQKFERNSNPTDSNKSDSSIQKYIARFKKRLEKTGLTKYFAPYRPYEFYKAGSLKGDIINVAKSVGLEYMFSKSGFNSYPKVKYIDRDFIALNYTAGHWDGWTPFETVNDVSDLRRVEKTLLKRKKPGWIVSTIDSCLWTFGGEFWKRGNKLFDIANFCVKGGNSGKIINVKPYTIARYARIIAEKEL